MLIRCWYDGGELGVGMMGVNGGYMLLWPNWKGCVLMCCGKFWLWISLGGYFLFISFFLGVVLK